MRCNQLPSRSRISGSMTIASVRRHHVLPLVGGEVALLHSSALQNHATLPGDCLTPAGAFAVMARTNHFPDNATHIRGRIMRTTAAAVHCCAPAVLHAVCECWKARRYHQNPRSRERDTEIDTRDGSFPRLRNLDMLLHLADRCGGGSDSRLRRIGVFRRAFFFSNNRRRRGTTIAATHDGSNRSGEQRILGSRVADVAKGCAGSGFRGRGDVFVRLRFCRRREGLC